MEENSNGVTLTGEHNDVTRGNEFNGYTDFKTRLDTELRANAEGFVRIGYLLKVARDTDILKESGHKNVADFAAAEYGLTKDIVSRYIAINDRYSEGGYSDRLQAKFEGYGVSKLQEMLTLPDYIIDEITPTLTRAEIQEIKAEVKAENEITPIEVAIEAAAPEVQAEEKELSFTCRAWKQYFSADTAELEMEKFLQLECDYYHSLVVTDGQVKRAKELFFNVFGGRIVWARIPGVGRIMISVSNEQEDKVTFTNSRTGEKKVVNSSEAMSDIKELTDSRGCTAEVFKELFRAKSEETKLTESTKEETHMEADNEKECSKETVDNRNKGNEDREISESTDRDGHETSDAQDDRVKSDEVAPVQQAEPTENENGLTLVNENSINWKKEEVVDAEYRDTEEGKEDNDRSGEIGEEGSRTENDNAVPAEVEQVTAEASGMANEKDLKDKISSIKDSADTISIICSELLANSYDADNLDKILEAVSKMTEKVAGLTEEWRRIRESVADGDD